MNAYSGAYRRYQWRRRDRAAQPESDSSGPSGQKDRPANDDELRLRSVIRLAPVWKRDDRQHSNEQDRDEMSDILIEDGYDWLG
jgi:hypothetical protein